MRRSVALGQLTLGLCILGPSVACVDEQDDPQSPGEPAFRGLADGLELHWTFEDRVGSQVLDVSGKGRHGLLTGGAFVASPNGEAAALDGVDDYIALTHLGLRSPTLYGGASGDFTVSARVRVNDASKYNTLCVGCGPFSSMFVGTANYGAKVLAAVSKQGGGTLWPLSTTSLGNDEWREVTMIVDGGTSVRYYLDCASDGELVNADVGLADYGYSAVGQGAAADRWFAGEIDELRVWSRALTAAEIGELCPTTLDTGLVLRWSFEDRNAEQITDLSGNGRHGTMIGGSFVASPSGEAAALDGVDDYIAFAGPRSPALYGGVDGDFTISARVRVDDLAKYNTLCFGCGPFSTWFLGDAVYGGRMTSAFFNQGNNGLLWTASTPAMIADAWTEVTLVVDGGTAVRHYLDCDLDSQLASANLGLKDYGFSAVGYSSNAARWFGGEIDELKIWDRALSDAEVAQLCPAQGLCEGPIHVDVDAPAGGDGLTWATAFADVQDALDAALACPSPQIWVAEGSYAPADNTLPVATITAPVALYGGFAGAETSLAQRDVVAHPTRLGADGWEARVVDIQASAIEAGALVRVDGFTISNSNKGAIRLSDPMIDTQEHVVALHDLVISGNTQTAGAGLLSEGRFGVDVVGCRFEGNDDKFSGIGGAAVLYEHSHLYIDDSEFIANETGYVAAIRGLWDNDVDAYGDWGSLNFTDSVVSGTIGRAIYAHDVSATNTEFSYNNYGALYLTAGQIELHGCSLVGNYVSASYGGGAIHISDGNGDSSVVITDSSFVDNSSRRGGAIATKRYYDHELSLTISGGEFRTNSATLGNGGAIYGDVLDALTIDGVDFVGNSSDYYSGAVYLEDGPATITGSSFVDNTGGNGGAIVVDTLATLTLESSRFVGNDAVTNGGAILFVGGMQDDSVINSEFVGNTAGKYGGGVYGRANFSSTTFANNSASIFGHGLYAPAGSQMSMTGVVAWPDNISAADMILDHSCMPLVTQPNINIGTVWLDADPFAPADLDLDGLTEHYLAPGSACVDLGGTVVEFDWAALTTQSSQCTDTTPLDAGVHYPPQSAVGPC